MTLLYVTVAAGVVASVLLFIFGLPKTFFGLRKDARIETERPAMLLRAIKLVQKGMSCSMERTAHSHTDVFVHYDTESKVNIRHETHVAGDSVSMFDAGGTLMEFSYSRGKITGPDVTDDEQKSGQTLMELLRAKEMDCRGSGT